MASHSPLRISASRHASLRGLDAAICTSAIPELETAIPAPPTAFALLPCAKRSTSCKGGTSTGRLSLAHITRFQDADDAFPCVSALHRADSHFCNKVGFPVHAPILSSLSIRLMSCLRRFQPTPSMCETDDSETNNCYQRVRLRLRHLHLLTAFPRHIPAGAPRPVALLSAGVRVPGQDARTGTHAWRTIACTSSAVSPRWAHGGRPPVCCSCSRARQRRSVICPTCQA